MEKKKTDIRFDREKNSDFISELRRQVADYFRNNKIPTHGNWKLFLKSVFIFLIYTVPYVLMITGIVESFYFVLVCWIIIGVGKAGVGMVVMHDANHRSYSKNKRVNRLLGKSLYLLGGFPINWLYQHNTLHHGFTNIDGVDEDIDPGAFLRLSPHKPLLRIHKFQHIYAWFLYGFMTISWVTVKDFTQLLRYSKMGALKGKRSLGNLFFTLTVSKILYYFVFLLIPVIVLPFSWYWIILFFISMHFVTGFILSVIFQTAHVVTLTEYPLPNNDSTMENNWAVHQMLTTADFSPKSKIFSGLIGGLNYQIEHHLFPNISHIHYPKISGMVKEIAGKYNVPYHVLPNFITAVLEHARMLKLLGSVKSI